MLLVLISVRGWVNPRGLVRREGLGKLNKLIHLNGSRPHDLPACSMCPNLYATAWPGKSCWLYYNLDTIITQHLIILALGLNNTPPYLIKSDKHLFTEGIRLISGVSWVFRKGNISFDIASGYRLDGRWMEIIFPARPRHFLSIHSRPAPSPTQPHIEWIPRALSLGRQPTWIEAVHWNLSGGDKNTWSCIPAPLIFLWFGA
jgi:hypothetical protein